MKFLRLIKYTALIASAVMAAQPAAEGQAAKSAPEIHMGTYREARPGEPFSLGGQYIYSLQAVESKPSSRKGYQVLVIKEWVTNAHDSPTDFVLQSECSIEIWDKNSNRVAEVDQSYTEKDGHVAQSLNPGQTALFWECFEISNRVAREGFKVEFISENNRVFVPLVPVSGALARP
jgi:hypothetical protein